MVAGVGSSIFQNAMASKLRSGELDGSIALRSEAFVQQLWRLSSGDPTKPMILDAYVFGLRSIYLFFTCIAGVAFVLSLFSKQYHMREEVESDHVLEKMQFELSI